VHPQAQPDELELPPESQECLLQAHSSRAQLALLLAVPLQREPQELAP